MKRITINTNIIVAGKHCQAGDIVEAPDRIAANLIGSALATEAPIEKPRSTPAATEKTPPPVAKKSPIKNLFRKG